MIISITWGIATLAKNNNGQANSIPRAAISQEYAKPDLVLLSAIKPIAVINKIDTAKIGKKVIIKDYPTSPINFQLQIFDLSIFFLYRLASN